MPSSSACRALVDRLSLRKLCRWYTVAILCWASACHPRASDNHVAVARATRGLRNCDGPAASLPAKLAATLAPRTGMMRPDDQWADIAARVPGGFAGIVYRDGKPVLMLTRPEEAEAARDSLTPLLPSRFPVRTAIVEPARWDFAQLVDWFNYLVQRTSLWSLGVTFGDKSELDNRIKFGVRDTASLVRVRAVLDSVPIPCDLVMLVVSGENRWGPASRVPPAK